MRHIAKVEISPELIAIVLATGYRTTLCKCTDGLPVGVVLINGFINRYNNLELHFEHPDFPEIVDGSEPTFIKPIYTFVDKEIT